MNSFKVTENVYWVGVRDPELEIFDIVIPTEQGTTYNSYLVIGKEKKALIEANKLDFKDTYIKTIEEICPISEIDYLILNHNEPDHSGCLPALLAIKPELEVLYSKTAKNFVDNIVNGPYNGRAVGDDDIIDLGGLTLRFFHAPFLHWPDTMFTYLPEKNILFPCDFLGAHYCSGKKLFNDELENKEEAMEAFRFYYSMIMRPYQEHILKALQKIKDIKIDMICPSHGPILRENPQMYIDWYQNQANRYYKNMPERQVSIVYATAYGNTKMLAESIKKGVEETGLKAVLLDAATMPVGEIIDEIEVSYGLLIGTPTLNAKAPKPILNLFAYFVVLNMVGRLAGAFGSFGWSGEGVKVSEDIMKTMRMKVPQEPFKVKMTPSADDLANAYAWGRDFGMAVLEA